jgi:hypothetical protein
MFRRFHPLLPLLIAIGFAAALLALTQRFGVEARSRAVALVLDYGQLRTLSSAGGVPIGEALRSFKAAGITGVAVSEETLGELQDDGALEVRMGLAADGGREYRVSIGDPALAERVADYTSRFVRGATERAPSGDRVALPGPGGGTIYLPGRFEDLRLTPTGLDERAVRQIREAGLQPVGRLWNPLGLSAESLKWELQRVKDLGIHTLIFAGEEVLGFRGLIRETAAAFRDLGLIYGSVEMGKQRGDQTLSALLPDRLVRVHSISAAEMPRMTPRDAIERYTRAAAERNIRLNYVRLPSAVTAKTFQDSIDYVRSLANHVAREGFGLAEPVPFGRVWPEGAAGRLVPALIALAVGAGAVLLLAGLVPLSLRLQALLGGLAALLCAGLALSPLPQGVQAVALLAAIVFPTLGFVLFPQPVAAFEDHTHAAVRRRSQAIVPAVAEFAAISAVTLAGAVMAAGLLSELPYLVKVQSFAGIKVATIAPILLVGLIYLTGMSGQYPSVPSEREAVEARARGFLSEPLRVWHTAAVLVGLVALALLVARSGNDPGVGVSELELKFRSLLDRVMGVRPRTKEFLLGHPAMLLGLALATVPRWRPLAFSLLLVGIIGQTGMLNSFCHLHTPIKMTVIRTFNGLWTGGLIGLALIWIWLLISRQSISRQKAEGSRQ